MKLSVFLFILSFNFLRQGLEIFDTFSKLAVFSTYRATEAVIEDLKKKTDSYKKPKEKYEYLFNKNHNTAVLLKSISRSSQRLFEGKRNKRRNKYDEANRITTVLCGKLAIQHFLNQEKFLRYTLAVPIGSVRHEACIFFRNAGVNIEAIFFNPSFSTLHDGVEYSSIAKELIESLRGRLNKTMAYFSPTGNVESQCSKIAWIEIFNHVHYNKNPFERKEILLEDYNRLITAQTYKRYHSIGRVNHYEENELIFYNLWKSIDDKLGSISDFDFMKISRDFNRIIANYFSSKSQ